MAVTPQAGIKHGGESGDVFQDMSESGKDRNWRKRKLSNLSMYDAFEIIESRGEIAQQKLDRIYRCAGCSDV